MLVMALPVAAQGGAGMGDLMIMPTRVVFEGRDRSAEVILRNAGLKPSTYRIFFQEMRMQDSGDLKEVPRTEGGLAASDLVRYSPRQVLLGPGESQTVRIQVRRQENLPDGEYRSHLVFMSLPPVEPARIPQGEERTVNVNIQTLVALSIPVIVRQGETHATVSLSDLAFHPATGPQDHPSLDLRMALTGNRSLQGEFKVDWHPRSGRAGNLLPVAGAVIYPDVKSRTVHLDLTEAKGFALQDGRLQVTYTYTDTRQPPAVASLTLP